MIEFNNLVENEEYYFHLEYYDSPIIARFDHYDERFAVLTILVPFYDNYGNIILREGQVNFHLDDVLVERIALRHSVPLRPKSIWKEEGAYV